MRRLVLGRAAEATIAISCQKSPATKILINNHPHPKAKSGSEILRAELACNWEALTRPRALRSRGGSSESVGVFRRLQCTAGSRKS